MNDEQFELAEALYRWAPPQEHCIGFGPLRIDLPWWHEKRVRRVMHELRDLGYVEFYRGLIRESDGKCAGSGYTMTEKGAKKLYRCGREVRRAYWE